MPRPAEPSRAKQMCGRCGYDLGGVIDSWDAATHPACPLEGVCSECGDRFRWREILQSNLLERAWLVEHARSKGGVLKRIPRTAWRVAFPWRFWRTLSIQAPVRPRVALLAVLLLLVPVQMFWGITTTTLRISQTYNWMNSRYVSNPATYYRKNGMVMPPNAPAPRVPPLAWDSVPIFLLGSAGEPVLQADLWWWPTPLFPTAADPTGGGVTSKLSIQLNTRALPWWAMASGAAALTWMGIFLVLPTTRAVAKIRSAHLARAAIYSFGAWWVMFCIGRALIPSQMGSSAIEWLAAAFTVGWVGVWWICAVTIGWKIERGRWVAGLLLLASLLAALTVGAIFDPYFLSWTIL